MPASLDWHQVSALAIQFSALLTDGSGTPRLYSLKGTPLFKLLGWVAGQIALDSDTWGGMEIAGITPLEAAQVNGPLSSPNVIFTVRVTLLVCSFLNGMVIKESSFS